MTGMLRFIGHRLLMISVFAVERALHFDQLPVKSKLLVGTSSSP